MTQRLGDWILTYTGKRFYPLDPHFEDFDILDIAHALSMTCRYAGHCKRFYSVAEHSVILARWIKKTYGVTYYTRWALLHDASEAYILDIPRPLKPSLTGYAAIEAGIMSKVADHFMLYGTMPAEVKDADDRILADEKAANHHHTPWDNMPGPPLGVELYFWTPQEAEAAFLDEFAQVYA